MSGILSDRGLVLGPEELSKLETKKVSASAISALEGCAASWGYNSFYSHLIKDNNIDEANVLGEIFHNSLEKFFTHNKKERTLPVLQDCIKQVLFTHPLREEFEHSKYAQNWFKNAIQKYLEFEPDYENINIATINTKHGQRLGLEYCIVEDIPDCSRKFIGFVDRIVQNPDETITVQDYKTGRLKQYDTKTGEGDGLAGARQQTLYAVFLEKQGHNVDKTELLFPIDQKIVDINHKNPVFRQKCLDDAKKTGELMDKYWQENLLPYEPSILCAWCPLAKICPKRDIKNNEKAKKAFNNQPEPETFTGTITVKN